MDIAVLVQEHYLWQVFLQVLGQVLERNVVCPLLLDRDLNLVFSFFSCSQNDLALAYIFWPVVLEVHEHFLVWILLTLLDGFETEQELVLGQVSRV